MGTAQAKRSDRVREKPEGRRAMGSLFFLLLVSGFVPCSVVVVVGVGSWGGFKLDGWEGRGRRCGRGVVSDSGPGSGSVLLGSVVEDDEDEELVVAEEVERRAWLGPAGVGVGVVDVGGELALVTKLTISADLVCQSVMVRR
jgi:hypothetical protein